MSLPAADQPTARARRGRGGRSWIGWLIAGILIVLLFVAVWVGVRGLLAANELRQALPVASRVQSAIMSGDANGAAQGLAELRTRADKAHALTSDPIWRAVEAVPWLGPNLRAVDGVSTSAASVSDGGAGSIASLAGKLGAGTFAPRNGAIDLAPLSAAAPALGKADAAVQSGERTASGISTSGVIGPLAQAVTRYKTELAQVATFTDAARRAAVLLPPMLGADGPRTYLVLVLNNAELRSTGGIPGSVVHVTVNDGHITLDSEYAGTTFGPYDQPVAALSAATQQLFGDITGQYMQDVTLTPHFDQTAQLAAAMWQQRFGQSVDGVVSLDPVALKYILTATGPVTFGAGTPYQTQLTSGTVVKSLLSDVYARIPDPNQQDAYFAAASSAVFSKLADGEFSPSAMLTAFSQIGTERRMNVWSANPKERAELAGTTLAGGLPQASATEQRFGVYLADGTGSKMDYYLHTKVQLARLGCSTGSLYVVQVTLTNGVTAAEAAALPEYVTGGDVYGVPVGTIRTQVTTYGSPGVGFGHALNAAGGGEPAKVVNDGDRTAAQYVADLKPGQSSTVRLVFNAKKGAGGGIAAEVTPQINAVPMTHGAFSCAELLK